MLKDARGALYSPRTANLLSRTTIFVSDTALYNLGMLGVPMCTCAANVFLQGPQPASGPKPCLTWRHGMACQLCVHGGLRTSRRARVGPTVIGLLLPHVGPT